jgi:diaminohydroxyphosphoribosylaminopyrimidine deaminase / 5-amino-6-(5-phosphoribosylamino)uracil reductase
MIKLQFMFSPSFHFNEAGQVRAQDIFMKRCLQLAGLGAGYTAPNPLVGAVLVHDGRIIGEGYHELYGGPHAEPNCLASVKAADRFLIPFSTLYVSLEPCVHHGKTPPCTDLIIREKIPKLVVGCLDPFREVNGKGIEKLIAHGIEVEYPVLEELSKDSNRRFFTFQQKKRPYVILKWAQSANHKIAGKNTERISISNDFTNRLVHKWRSEEAGILIGTNTALNDDPSLTTRLWAGKTPVRIIVDPELRLPASLKIFDGQVRTIILNGKRDEQTGTVLYKKTEGGNRGVPAILSAIHALHISSIIVEGGSKMLQAFIDSGIWDEARIITNNQLFIPDGLPSPEFSGATPVKSEDYGTDTVNYYDQ